jgi:hypothetical protein
MEIVDYKRLFEIKYVEGWSDEDVWYAKCRFCESLPVFNIYNIKNWHILNNDQRKKRFYTAIKRHINTHHPELILPKKTKILEQEATLNKGLYFLKNFPFRPYKDEPLKVWKPGNIVLPKKKESKSD